MKRSLALLLMTSMTCLPLAFAAQAQEKPAEKASSIPFAKREFDAQKQTNAKLTALEKAMRQKVEAAFKGEEKLRAAMQADLKAVSAEKNPQTRKTLAAAYQAKYAKDTQRVLGKANIDMQGFASQMRAIDPSIAYTVVGTKIVGKSAATAQSQPAQAPSSAPASLSTVKELTSADYRFTNEGDCASGWGASTRSGGYMKSEGEGCTTSGTMFHEFEVPAGKTARVEMTASLFSEAHTIATSSSARSAVRIAREDGQTLQHAVVSSSVRELLFGEDAFMNDEGVSIIRDLSPGRYRVEGSTSMTASDVSPGWAVSEARVERLRVKITLSPK